MDSKSSFYSEQSGAHGTDEIGALQPSVAILSFSSSDGYAGGRFTSKTLVTESVAHTLKKGQAINIASPTGYAGPSRVLHVLSPTAYIIAKALGPTGATTGARDGLGGLGAWDAFIPMGGDLATGAISTLTYFDQNKQGGRPTAVSYQQGRLYPFPGIIKSIVLTSGNLKLFRAASLNPDGRS